jgi:hypothetical protein
VLTFRAFYQLPAVAVLLVSLFTSCADSDPTPQQGARLTRTLFYQDGALPAQRDTTYQTPEMVATAYTNEAGTALTVVLRDTAAQDRVNYHESLELLLPQLTPSKIGTYEFRTAPALSNSTASDVRYYLSVPRADNNTLNAVSYTSQQPVTGEITITTYNARSRRVSGYFSVTLGNFRDANLWSPTGTGASRIANCTLTGTFTNLDIVVD